MHRDAFGASVNMKMFYLEALAGDQLKLQSTMLVCGGVVGAVQHKIPHKHPWKVALHMGLGLYLCRFYSDARNAMVERGSCLCRPVVESEYHGVHVLLAVSE